tara:strand:- start:14309 stop:15676 length:1368 start_codon:yes stop_codon:yes gene_type:complete
MTLSQQIANQKSSFFKGINRPLSTRMKHLSTLRELVQDNESLFYEALQKDLGKPEFEVYTTEIITVLNEIDVHLKNVKQWAKVRATGNSYFTFPSKSKIYSQPLGVVLIIGAWNYPIHLTLMPLIGAISAGNTIALKPSELAPNTSSLLAKLFRYYFEPDFISVHEGGADTSTKLLKEPFDKIFFTGSTHVGKIVMKAAAEHLTPVTLELGGKSPAIIHKDADITVSSNRIWWGKTLNAGQTCVAPDFVAIHESKKAEFIEESKKTLLNFFNNDYIIGSNYTQIVNTSHYERLTHLLQTGKIIAGGNTDPDTRFIEPTLMEAEWDDFIMQEEIFGPLLPLITFSKPEEVMQKLQDMPSPLALYLFTEDEQFQKDIITHVPFGGGCVNETVSYLANHHLPFGGVGKSGMGSYHGKYSFDTFSREQSILYKSYWPDPDLRYPPYDDKIITWFKRLFS